MSKNFDVIVLGVGAMGASCCDHLAQRGARVLGLERFDVPHQLGSSGGQTRLIRKAYYEHPDYVPLLERAYRNWDALDARLEAPVLHRCGCLFVGPEEGPLVAGTRRAAAAHDLPLERLDPDATRRRWPIEVPEHFSVLFEPEAGFVLSERAIGAYAELAARAGAEIHAREPALDWQTDDDGVTVRTARATYTADRLVVTAGAWSPQLLAGLGIELRVSRQVVGWVWPRAPERFELGAFPCWAIEDDGEGFEGIYYGFPLLRAGRFGGERGLKLGHHRVGTPTDADRIVREASAADEADFRRPIDRYLPLADGPTQAVRVCMYTLTPDHHFIVDRHPGEPRVTVACGFSGHGFKFASVIGEALSDLALDGSTELPVGFLGVERFHNGSGSDPGPVATEREVS